MSVADGWQRRLTADALAALSDTDFALAGFGAIREHGISSRPTQDVDLFTTNDDPGRFNDALTSLVAALTERGYAVEVIRRAAVFARFEVRTPDGTALELDLGADWRGHDPKPTSVGPVISLEDAVASKIGALFSRAETRDFLDADAIRQSRRFTDEELLQMIAKRDPGFDRTVFAQQLLLVRHLSVAETGRYYISAENHIDIQTRLTEWAHTLLIEAAEDETL